MPVSSRTSRTAADSFDSPFSTVPLGSCHRRVSPTEINATSTRAPCLRKATPPDDTWLTVGILLCVEGMFGTEWEKQLYVKVSHGLEDHSFHSAAVSPPAAGIVTVILRGNAPYRHRVAECLLEEQTAAPSMDAERVEVE